MQYFAIKMGRGTAVHAGIVGTRGPICQHISGYYSPLTSEALIDCKKCLAAIKRNEEFLAKRGLA